MSSSRASRGRGARASSSASAGAVPPIVLLAGPEAALRDAAIAKLRERLIGTGPRDFNEDRFDFGASGAEAGRVIAACRTHPVMALGRLVLVRGLEDRRAASFLDEPLLSYLEDPMPTTCLVLDLPAKPDRRRAWVKQVEKIGEVVDCSAPSRSDDVRNWIEDRARTLGLEPGRGMAAALFDLVGADLDRLGLELEKLSLYVGERREATAEDVAELTGELRSRALYELTDAIGERRLEAALRCVAKLLRQGEAPLAMLGTLANHFRRLIRARECQPLDGPTIQQKLAVHPFAARKLAEQARRFDMRRLRTCLDAVRRTDEALKGSLPLSPKLAIERLVLAVCR